MPASAPRMPPMTNACILYAYTFLPSERTAFSSSRMPFRTRPQGLRISSQTMTQQTITKAPADDPDLGCSCLGTLREGVHVVEPSFEGGQAVGGTGHGVSWLVVTTYRTISAAAMVTMAR